ncbi:DNA-binding transcriptional ArsR family regulator [Halanaerobium saccharolyticum]|uniref:DNA-binding transcriptional ArsR family regulator n=1 Tax=Halanaerobium saccharolyticum TaxID=43595 RepID=A0A4R6M014_9FIRM|nr:metalloregulator ArsR/SmtB family transcription factor [Halanaerobium saccharolyticum]TDO94424.1 DNA-binding transcriptional ArsR family regulator [Halanaerobium saccharolyticum]
MSMKKYQLDRSIIYEFLLSLFRLENSEGMKLKKLELEKEIKLEKEIVNWVEEKQKKIPKTKRNLIAKYFNEESYFGLCLVSEIPYLELTNIEEYLNYLKTKEAADFIKRFTQSGYGPASSEKVDLDKVKNLINNEKRAAKFVNDKINLASDQKWNLLHFYFNPEEMKSEFIDLLEWYYEEVFKEDLDWINNKLKKINDTYEENLNRYGENYLENILEKLIDEPLNAEENYIAFSYFYETSLLNSISDSGDNFYMIGFRFPEIFAADKEGILGSLEIFKALADETRLNIISLLAEKTMYGNEIAEKLNLTNATISHHVSKLLMNNIINAHKEDNKLYFQLNKKSFKKIILKSIDNLI